MTRGAPTPGLTRRQRRFRKLAEPFKVIFPKMSERVVLAAAESG